MRLEFLVQLYFRVLLCAMSYLISLSTPELGGSSLSLTTGNYDLTVALNGLHHTGVKVSLSNSQKKATEHTSQNTEPQLVNALFGTI